MQFWFHNYYFMTVLLELFPCKNFQIFLNFMSWSYAAVEVNICEICWWAVQGSECSALRLASYIWEKTNKYLPGVFKKYHFADSNKLVAANLKNILLDFTLPSTVKKHIEELHLSEI